ncbi:MAG: polysaccharide deacetylase family protein [Hyphomicrobiaceae bacterium]|nr:polysaccharide deacetylase family protein [Hyphomicrobiaceae bacterium]
MRHMVSIMLVMVSCLVAAAARAADCRAPDTAIGLARTVEIDARGGPLYGSITKQIREASFLAPKEVVLTFDDGPSPWVTQPILETLARHCTKATFFAVGKMALAYPALVRRILDEGHTLGGHTWSHPKNLPGLRPARATDEIERGFAAIAAASGGDVAPFFRFTGLRDGPALLSYLQGRGIASFTVDVVSDDSFIDDVGELVRVTLSRIAQQKGGILLFHDIKPATAKALPLILDALKANGYKVVHLRSASRLEADAGLVAGFAPMVAAKLAESGTETAPQLMPFYGALEALRGAGAEGAPSPQPDANLTRLAPAPRPRAVAPEPTAPASGAPSDAPRVARPKPTGAPFTGVDQPAAGEAGGGWAVRAVPERAPNAVR